MNDIKVAIIFCGVFIAVMFYINFWIGCFFFRFRHKWVSGVKMTKICSKCKIEKELSKFNKDKRNKDGYRYPCKACDNKIAKKWKVTNPIKVANDSKNWKVNNSDHVKATSKIYRENNKDNIKETNKRWRHNNPGKTNERLARRRAAKLNATLKWLTKEQLKEMIEIYQEAKDIQWLSEEPLEVDHIIPLQGKTVSGLHVPWNLRITTRSFNRSKGNKYE